MRRNERKEGLLYFNYFSVISGIMQADAFTELWGCMDKDKIVLCIMGNCVPDLSWSRSMEVGAPQWWEPVITHLCYCRLSSLLCTTAMQADRFMCVMCVSLRYVSYYPDLFKALRYLFILDLSKCCCKYSDHKMRVYDFLQNMWTACFLFAC